MSSPFIGQIMVFPGNFAPDGWMLCDGRLLSASQYRDLFNLIGTSYGGDSQNFALPDLRSRVAIGQGHCPWLSNYPLATQTGVENVTLTVAQLPAHGHPLLAVSAPGTTNIPANNVLLAAPGGQAGSPPYQTPAYAPPGTQTALNGASVGPTGGSQPHANVQPYTAMNFCIAVTGIHPH